MYVKVLFYTPEHTCKCICRDIFSLLQSPELFDSAIQLLAQHIKLQNLTVDVVVGLEARGFLIGPLLAQKLNAAFVPIRKIGKLPGITSRQAYSLEYGQVEIDDNISNKTVVIRLFFALKILIILFVYIIKLILLCNIFIFY